MLVRVELRDSDGEDEYMVDAYVDGDLKHSEGANCTPQFIEYIADLFGWQADGNAFEFRMSREELIGMIREEMVSGRLGDRDPGTTLFITCMLHVL